MAPLSEESFERRFRSLSRERRAAFVADLLAAEGWSVERNGRVVTATDGGEERTVIVGSPGSVLELDRTAGSPGPEDDGIDDTAPRTQDVDAVVGVRPRYASLPVLGSFYRESERERAVAIGAEFVDPDELYQRLLYAIDRDEAATLLESHLGVDIDASSTEPRRARHVIALAVVALVFAGIGAAVLFPGPEPQEPTPAAATNATGATSLNSGTGDVAGYPSGLSADGIENADTLAEAHVIGLQRHSTVRLQIEYAGPVDEPDVSNAVDDDVVIEIEATSDERYRIVRRGEDVEERFADGEYEYRRIDRGDGPTYERRSLEESQGGSELIEQRTRFLIERYLNTTESQVEPVDDSPDTDHRIVASGQPWRLDHSTREYGATAVVRQDGVVTEFDVGYFRPDETEPVAITYRYEDAVDLDPSPPDWYEEAREETAVEGENG